MNFKNGWTEGKIWGESAVNISQVHLKPSNAAPVDVLSALLSSM